MCVFRGRIHTHRVPPQWFAHEITLIYDSLAVEHVGLSQVRSIQVNVLHFPSKFSLHLHRSLFLILIFFSFPSSNLVKFFSFVFFIQFSRELQFLILCIKKFKYFDSCNSNFFVYWYYSYIIREFDELMEIASSMEINMGKLAARVLFSFYSFWSENKTRVRKNEKKKLF